MRKVYLDAESMDLMLVPTRPEYEYVFIQTEGACSVTIDLKPFADTKFKITIYIYAEGTSSVDCVCRLNIPQDVKGVESDIQIRSWPFDRSKIRARPEMFIANSDVQAAHGNALGTLSAEQQYYLATRGLADYKQLIKESLLNA